MLVEAYPPPHRLPHDQLLRSKQVLHLASELRPRPLTPVLPLPSADVADRDPEDGFAMVLVGPRPVAPADPSTHDLVVAAQFRAFQHAQEERQALLREDEFAEAVADLVRAGVVEAHVQLDEDAHAEVEIEVREEGSGVDVADAARVVGYVQHEPHALEREGAARRKGDAVFGHDGHDLVDHLFAVQDHLEPAEGGHGADLARLRFHGVGMWDAGRGIEAAEVRVAAEGEDS